MMRVPLMTSTFTSAWIACRCGDVFHASGKPRTVSKKKQAWEARHKDCVEQKREGSKVFWLSFCDADRPKGKQFLGACIVEVTAEEADESAIDVLLRFPLAQPGAEWIAAAVGKAHRLGVNPGGEVATMEMPKDHPNMSHYTYGVLMDKATITRIDKAINEVL